MSTNHKREIVTAVGDGGQQEPQGGASALERLAQQRNLLERCRNGDSTAWAEVYNRYERLVFSTALRVGLSREDSADVSQATFLALFNSIDKIRDVERLPLWLITVARRQAWHVSVARREVWELPPELASREDAIGEWERITVVRSAVELLDTPCRDLLNGLFFDPSQPSYGEMARRMGRSVGGIGPMRGRCLECLQKILGGDSETWAVL